MSLEQPSSKEESVTMKIILEQLEGMEEGEFRDFNTQDSPTFMDAMLLNFGNIPYSGYFRSISGDVYHYLFNGPEHDHVTIGKGEEENWMKK